jgi:transporter family protein
MWWIYALLSAVFAAFTAILAKKGVENIDPDLATAIRTVIILMTTWMIVIAKGSLPSVTTISTRNFIFLIASGLATGLSWLFYFRALQIGEASRVAPVDKLSVAITVILAVVFLGEPVSLRTWFGTVLIVAGAILVIR